MHFAAIPATIFDVLGSFSHFAAPMAVTALWQSIAVAAALALCLRVAPRISAAGRFQLWAAAFAVLMALPFLPGLLSLATPTGNVSAVSVVPASAHPWLQLDLRWTAAIGLFWVAGSAIRAVGLAVHSLRLRRLWKSALPVEMPSDSASSQAISARTARHAQICTTRDLDRPSVIGFFSPRILIPEWLLPRLTTEELKQVVLHESEHLRRRDDWINLAQKLCLVLFPLNPALVWIERRLCREREMACDEGVIRITHAPRAYAACLASLAERGLQRRSEALALGAWHRRPELVHRVHSILMRKRGLHPAAATALLGTLGCGLVLGSVELSRCPQLVAFVPAVRPVVARSFTSTDPQVLDAVYSPAREAKFQGAGLRGPVQHLHATNVMADMPGTASAGLRRYPAGQHAAQVRSRLKFEAASSAPSASAPRQPLLRADLALAQPGQEDQQFIVFTSWEQVNPQAGEQAIMENAGAASSTNEAIDTKNSPKPGTITVTRLIFRVLPAVFPVSRDTIIPVRSSWLFIEQL